MQEFSNAVEAIQHSATRKQQRIGYSTKRRKRIAGGGTLISVIAGQMLAEANGTIEFDPYSKTNKEVDHFKSIYEYISWYQPVEPCGHGWRRIRDPDTRQRSSSIQKHRRSLSNGFRMFAAFHVEGHAAWPIYFVSESPTSKAIVAITANPNHELLAGMSAKEVAIARNENQGISGAVSHGKKAARLGQPVPEYLRSLRDSLSSLKNTKVIDLKPRFNFNDELDEPEFQQDFHFTDDSDQP